VREKEEEEEEEEVKTSVTTQCLKRQYRPDSSFSWRTSKNRSSSSHKSVCSEGPSIIFECEEYS
jgi:hypothetical protein